MFTRFDASGGTAFDIHNDEPKLGGVIEFDNTYGIPLQDPNGVGVGVSVGPDVGFGVGVGVGVFVDGNGVDVAGNDVGVLVAGKGVGVLVAATVGVGVDVAGTLVGIGVGVGKFPQSITCVIWFDSIFTTVYVPFILII